MDVAVTVQVVSAVTGETLDVPVSGATATGAELARFVADACSLPAADQILLTGPPFVRLDPRRPLAYHSLPSPDKQVFLYDRRSLSRDASAPAAAADGGSSAPVAPLDVPEDVEQMSSSLSVDASSHPLLSAVALFEKRFLLSSAQGAAFQAGAEQRVARVRRLLAESEALCAALGAAQANLRDHARSAERAHGDFAAELAARREEAAALIAGLEPSLARLRDVRLHPAIATPELQTLEDCCPLEAERQWAQRCAAAMERLAAKAGEQAELFARVMGSVERAAAAADAEPPVVRELRAALGDATQQAAAQRALAGELRAHLDDITARVAEINDSFQAGSSSSSMSMPDLSRANEMWDRDREVMPALREADELLQAVERQALQAKAAVAQHLHRELRAVSGLQYKIQKLGQHLGLLRDGLETVRGDVGHLESVRRLPESYRACLEEVVRRREYARRFEAKATGMAEELARLRETEVEARQRFLHDHLVHLPPALLQQVHGLNERPPQFDLHAAPFDQTLPDITRASLSPAAAAAQGQEDKQDDQFMDDATRGSLLLAAESSDDDGDGLAQENARLRAELAQLRTAQPPRPEPTVLMVALRALLDAGAAAAGWSDSGMGFTVRDEAAEEWRAVDAEGSWPAVRAELLRYGFRTRAATNFWMHPCFQRDAPALAAGMRPGAPLLESQRTPEWDAFCAALPVPPPSSADAGAPPPAPAAAVRQPSTGTGASAASDTLRAHFDAVSAEAEAAAASAAAAQRASAEQLQQSSDLAAEAAALRERLAEREAQLAKAQADLAKAQADLAPHIRNAVSFEDDLRSLAQRGHALEAIIGTLADGFAQVDAELAAPLPSADSSSGGASGGWPRVRELDVVEAVDFGSAVDATRGRAAAAAALVTEARAAADARERELAALQRASQEKIACRAFQSDDLALFLRATPGEVPAGREDAVMYPAFHLGAPHHYLSEESILTVHQSEGRYPPYVVGRVVLIDRRTARADDNPFGLPLGTEFAVLTASFMGAAPGGPA